jgi:hypothetical protein
MQPALDCGSMKDWMKAFLAKDWVKVFLAFVALMVGAICLIAVAIRFFYDFLSGVVAVVAGVLLLAGGATYFWMNSRIYKK